MSAALAKGAAKGIAGDTAALAAKKAAKEAAEASAKKAAKEAAEAAAKKAGKEAAEAAAKKAGKEAAEAAAKKAATAAASEAAQKTAKSTAADAAAAASKKVLKKNVKTGLKIAAGVGGAMYLSNEMGKENEKIQQCTSDCLPLNYDELAYGDLSKSDLEYATTEPTDEQPVCSAEIEEDCGEYCSNTCKDIHKTSLLDKVTDAAGPLGGVVTAVGDVAGGVTGAITDVAGGVVDEALQAAGFPPLTGPDGLLAKFATYFKMAGAFCCCLCIVYIMFMFF
jgi:chemotaxis protein histidine kinase CheA